MVRIAASSFLGSRGLLSLSRRAAQTTILTQSPIVSLPPAHPSSPSSYLSLLSHSSIPALLAGLTTHETLTILACAQLHSDPAHYAPLYQPLCYANTALPEEYLEGLLNQVSIPFSEVTSAPPSFLASNISSVMSRIKLNAITLPSAPQRISAVFPTFSFLNHSCVPTCTLKPASSESEASLVTLKEVEEGEELTIDYFGGESVLTLRRHADFRHCSCLIPSFCDSLRSLQESQISKNGGGG